MHRFFFAIAFQLCLIIPVFAQFETGSVLGTIRDSNAGVITGAKITLINTATGITATTTTDSNGNYEFPTVTIGLYKITAEQAGFSRAVDPMLAAQSFDAILVSNTYHEIEEREPMLDHIRQALKPGGRPVIVEAITTKLRKASRLEQTTKHAFSPELLDTELRAAALKL